MRQHRQTGSIPAAGAAPQERSSTKSGPVKHKHHRGWRWLGFVLILLILLGCVGRLFLPIAVRNYVNRTLDRNLLYAGRIGSIRLHLWRGAYSIQTIQISKRTGNVPVPFFAAQDVDFSIQWNALLHRRIVARILVQQPQLNFVADSSQTDSQAGTGGPWLEMIRDLSPFSINSATIHDGSVHFRSYKEQKPVDVYLSHLEVSIDDLSNIRRQTTPLVTTVQVQAQAMDQAPLQLKMTLDPFSYRPTFHMGLRLLGLDVTRLNDLSLTYGKFDFKRGWFDLVMEVDSQEGQITGYAKTLFRNLKVFSLTQDLKEDGALQFFWQALIGGATTALKNIRHDQFGTLIPFSADASGATSTDLLATIGNVLRNAFVRAYLPRLEVGQSLTQDLQFGAPSFIDSLSTTAQTP